MSRVEELKERLDKAGEEILALLADGPKKTGELIEGLGHSGINFLVTKWIGDKKGDWDQSPHQLVLSDLVESGRIQWCFDEKDNVWYGLKGTWSEEECRHDRYGIWREVSDEDDEEVYRETPLCNIIDVGTDRDIHRSVLFGCCDTPDLWFQDVEVSPISGGARVVCKSCGRKGEVSD